jgi:hypothetical protein
MSRKILPVINDRTSQWVRELAVAIVLNDPSAISKPGYTFELVLGFDPFFSASFREIFYAKWNDINKKTQYKLCDFYMHEILKRFVKYGLYEINIDSLYRIKPKY